MTITGQSSLDKDAIDQMVRDAEAHAAEDSRRKEEAEIRNKADSLVYQTDKLLADQGDKLSPEDRSNVEGRLAELKTALAGSDVDTIRTATEALMTASQEFSQKLYEQAAASEAASGGGDSAGASAPNDDEVVDAEIVDDEES